jgi:NAD(P)-dependent dehydrogenase (short-subunit alcohol dehydrogenase family)
LHGRDEKRAETTAREIREKTNNEKLRYYLADLSSLDEVRRLAEEVRADHDRLVILINNARVCLFENGLSPGMATSYPSLLTISRPSC